MEVEKEKEIDSIILNPKKTLLEKNLLKNKEQFSPKSNGIQPKYFHNLFLKKIFNDPIVTKSSIKKKIFCF